MAQRHDDATGLAYVALEPVMRLQGIPKAKRNSTFEDIRAMEMAALDVKQAKRSG